MVRSRLLFEQQHRDSVSGKFTLAFHANPINLPFRSNCAMADTRYPRQTGRRCPATTPEVDSTTSRDNIDNSCLA